MKYPLTMRVLHWVMAVLVLIVLSVGIYMSMLPFEAPDKFDLYPWHRAFGVLVFALVAVRIVTRLTAGVPELPDTIPRATRIVAASVQAFFYVALLLMPVFGYIASSALPEIPGVPPVPSIWFFGLELPLAPVAKNYDTMKLFITLHEYLGYALLLALLAHVAGAIKHRFFDRRENDVLRRML